MRHIYMEIPVFNGDEASRWLSKAEQYFQEQGFSEEEIAATIMVAMESMARTWYLWWEVSTESFA